MSFFLYQYRSPFNFLDSFSKDDIDYFFGRENEIKEVLTLFKKNNLVILYGPSGSGKTSVAQCGLVNKFYDWEPFLIRRNLNIIDSFFESIEKKINKSGKSTGLFPKKKCDTIRQIFDEFFKSHNDVIKDELLKKLENTIDEIYKEVSIIPFFIFDQFEELFIENYKKEEVNQFSLLLSLITKKVSYSNAVICIQTEFFSELAKLETHNPYVMRHKCLIADPKPITIRKIIKLTFEYFNINQVKVGSSDEIDNSVKEKRLDKIIESLKKTGTYLPFLQIYLDKLYVTDFINTYPKGDHNLLLKPKEIDYKEKPLEFKVKEIEAFGNIDQILTNYIKQINASVVNKDNEIIKKGHEDTVIKFLQHFISDKDTRRSVEITFFDFHKSSKRYYIKNNDFKEKIVESIWGNKNEKVDASINDLISELIMARILKVRGEFLELSHNYLARIIKNIPIREQDNFRYYKNHFYSTYDIYQRQIDNHEKPTLLQPRIVKKLKNKINKIIPNDDSKINLSPKDYLKLKSTFWNKSVRKYKNKKIKDIIVLLLSFVTALTAFAFYHIYSLSEAEQKRLAIEAKYAEQKTNEIADTLSSAIRVGKTDLTKMYGTFGYIDSLINSSETLRNKEFPIVSDFYYRLTSDYFNKPFYCKKIVSELDDHIISSKIRKFSDDKFLAIFIKTTKNVKTKIISLNDLTDNTEWSTIEGENTINSYEPYLDSGNLRVIYSDSNGTSVLKEINDSIVRATNGLKNLSQIEFLRKTSNEVFVALSKNKRSLYKLIIDPNNNKKSGSKNDTINKYRINLKEFKVSVHNDSIQEVLGNPEIKHLLKSSDYNVCFIANVNVDGVFHPYLFKLNIFLRNRSEVTSFLDSYDLTKIRLNLDIDDIDALTINKDKNKILIAIERDVYAINLNDFDNGGEKHAAVKLISLSENTKITSLESKENYIIVGRDDKKANIFYLKNFNFYSKDSFSKELIGHNYAVINVSMIKNNFVYTFDDAGEINFWDLSPIEESISINKATHPINIRFKNNRLYASFSFNNEITRGNLIEINSNDFKKYKDLIKNGKRGFFKAFDVNFQNQVFFGNYWNGQITTFNIPSSRYEHFDNLGNIRVNDLKIKNSRLAIAANNGLFYYSDFKNKETRMRSHNNDTLDLKFNSIDIHPKKDLVLAASDDSNIYLWNVESQQIDTLSSHFDKVMDAEFSSDGNYIVSGSWDNTAIIWKYNAFQKAYIPNKYKLSGHDGDIEDVAITNDPDSSRLIIAIASNDKSVQLHELSTKPEDSINQKTKPILSIIRHNYDVKSITFGETPYIIYSTDIMGNIKKWKWRNFKDEIDKRTVKY